jgi:hypothetical protein
MNVSYVKMIRYVITGLNQTQGFILRGGWGGGGDTVLQRSGSSRYNRKGKKNNQIDFRKRQHKRKLGNIPFMKIRRIKLNKYRFCTDPRLNKIILTFRRIIGNI